MHLPFLFAAYTVVWIGLFVFVISLARRNRHLERELEELRRLVDQQKR
jgi:CcmD family protein